MDTCETIIPNICVPLWSKEDYTRYRSLLVTISSTIPSSLTVVIPSSKEWHQYFTVLSSFQRPHSLFPSRVVFSPTLNVEPGRQCITYGTRLVRIPIVPCSDPAKWVTTRRYIFSFPMKTSRVYARMKQQQRKKKTATKRLSRKEEEEEEEEEEKEEEEIV